MKERLEKLRNTLNLKWENLAERLGVSVSFLMQVQRGDRNMSGKTLFQLEKLEREAGISMPSQFPDLRKKLSEMSDEEIAKVAPLFEEQEALHENPDRDLLDELFRDAGDIAARARDLQVKAAKLNPNSPRAAEFLKKAGSKLISYRKSQRQAHRPERQTPSQPEAAPDESGS